MFELTIEGNVYQFRFGMGFVKEINNTVMVPVDGAPSVKQPSGLRYKVAELYDGNVIALADVLDIANKTCNPRITRNVLDAYIEDENTDIDKLFQDVLDFLSNANCTKTTVQKIAMLVEAQKQKM